MPFFANGCASPPAIVHMQRRIARIHRQSATPETNMQRHFVTCSADLLNFKYPAPNCTTACFSAVDVKSQRRNAPRQNAPRRIAGAPALAMAAPKSIEERPSHNSRASCGDVGFGRRPRHPAQNCCILGVGQRLASWIEGVRRPSHPAPNCDIQRRFADIQR